MSQTPIRDIVVVGGGTAGWMTAAALVRMVSPQCTIRLIESEAIGSVGVGEATIPPIRDFNDALGLDEDEFVRRTQGTYKLGIEFVDWGRQGTRYTHGFGRLGKDLDGVPFHHYWLRMREAGQADELHAYSINTAAPRQARFIRPRADMPDSPLADIASAFHFDASLYAQLLRHYGEQRGVRRTEGRITRVEAIPDGSGVAAVVMEDGQRVTGDLFVDCSGFRGLLIEQTLGAGFEDWSHWLPCDRAIAVPSERTEPLLPLTRATARTAGWQWRIPLQHRTGNGHVFCSRFISEDEATATLLANLDGPALAEPRTITFKAGMRSRSWVGNCVAVGLSSGFLEPLESTSIHLIQSAISRLMQYFPHRAFDAEDIAAFNRQMRFEYERVRDFVILHYHLTSRDDSAFWRHCQQMSVPETLTSKVALYASNGRIVRECNELFSEFSWLQVMHGQGVVARGHHPFVDLRGTAEVASFVDNVRNVINKCVAVMPTHAEFIAAHCAADGGA